MLKIRCVREMNVRKLNSVLVIREIARQVEKVLYWTLRRVTVKPSTRYTTSKAVLRKWVWGSTGKGDRPPRKNFYMEY